MSDATFVRPDLGAFCRLDELGLEVTAQRLEPGRAVLACRPVPSEFDRWCDRCGAAGKPRDSVTRWLAHEPFGHRPTSLLLTISRFACVSCRHVWRQDTHRAAEPRAKLSRRALAWALHAIVVQHLSVARVAEALAVTWNTANNAVLDEGRRVLINDPHRLDGVAVIGVDEHVWRHTRRGDKYVTVIIDLTPVRDGTGPARLIDMVEGRSKAVFKNWLDAQTASFRDGIEVVAMDGFTGFKTAAADVVPDAAAVIWIHSTSPRLPATPWTAAGNASSSRPAGTAAARVTRSMAHAGCCAPAPTCSPTNRRSGSPSCSTTTPTCKVEATWLYYQRIIAAYRDPDRATARTALTDIISELRASVPKPLTELITLGRTLNRRAADVLAYFERPGTSNGPTEAINGRLEHLRGTALGFRNLTNYIARSLLEAGGFRPQLHPGSG